MMGGGSSQYWSSFIGEKTTPQAPAEKPGNKLELRASPLPARAPAEWGLSGYRSCASGSVSHTHPARRPEILPNLRKIIRGVSLGERTSARNIRNDSV